MPLVSFDTPWKHQKTFRFLIFSGGIERGQWHDMGYLFWQKSYVIDAWQGSCASDQYIVSDFFLLTDVFFAITEQTYCAPVVDCGYFLFVELMGLFVFLFLSALLLLPHTYKQSPWEKLVEVCPVPRVNSNDFLQRCKCSKSAIEMLEKGVKYV